MADEHIAAGFQDVCHFFDDLTFGLRVEIDHNVAQEYQIDFFHRRKCFIQVDSGELDVVTYSLVDDECTFLRTYALEAIFSKKFFGNLFGLLQWIVALRVAREVENGVIVAIICDRGDRYLSTGVFPAD